ncbi:adenylosuccinate lyase [Patescibacteria group bacterium]|nr:adenylosuccinate lyase [Patescibacteria group bacterium]
MDAKYIVPQIAEIWSEKGRFERMLRVEVANCEAWYEASVIPEEDIKVIRLGARINWRVYRNRLANTRHDVSSFVAAVAYEVDKITKRRGLKSHPGRWIHHNLTSYDAWDTALAMQIRESIQILLESVDDLLNALRHRGQANWDTVMIGRTHGMHAEPTTFGTKLANYWHEVKTHRKNLVNVEKFWRVAKISGPVGTHEKIPAEVEESIANQLSVKPIPIATQIVPRVWVLRYLNHLDELAATIEKIGTDIRDMQRPEICEVEEYFPPEGVGSSIMVHKHNPEVSERCCSLAREIAGTVTTARMNVALWHERDLTNSANERTILFDASNLAVYIASKMAEVIWGLKIFPARMRKNLGLTAGIVQSGQVLNLLVERGIDRTKARGFISGHTNNAWKGYQEGRSMLSLKDELVKDPKITSILSESEITACFDPTHAQLLKGVKVSFRRLHWSVRAQKEVIRNG